MVSLTDSAGPSRRARPSARAGHLLLLGILVAGLTACRREQIAAYDAPKDAPPTPPPQAAQASPHGMGGGAGGTLEPMPARPGLKWKSLPEGWTSRGPSGMRAANFSMTGPEESQAELAAIPLPGTGGSDIDLVNLWRGQVGLPPIGDAELPSHTDETTLGGQSVKLFNIVGSGASDAAVAANQILVAALRKDGFTWFFKLAGDARAVAAHREALKTFLGSVEFTAPEAVAPPASAPAAAMAAAPAPAGGSSTPKWEVPTDWTAKAPGQMVLQRWSVPVTADGGADVSVSVFPGDTGGLIPNLNRWRSQVGLPPAPEAELNPLIDNLEVVGGKGTLVDFTGPSPESGKSMRIVAAVVRRGGQSWFYKLLGAPTAVEAQRPAFVQLVKTAQYSSGQ